MKRTQKAKLCEGCGKPFMLAPSMWRIRHCSRACQVDFDRKWIPEPNSGCWLWLGCVDEKGYGRVSLGGRLFPAHSRSYQRAKGRIPRGLEIDHLCRNPSCVNPDHLEPVTKQVNALRGIRSTRARAATHCPNGHEWTAVNTYRHPRSGSRVCRRCTTTSQEKYRSRINA